MKKKYLLIVLFAINLINSQNFHDTKGELAVTSAGTASYKIPIALPSGIKDVAPQLALVYNGTGVQGMAGIGWNLVGVSSITRISSRLDLDNTIDAVDFDNLDRFALDGQRLIEKIGTYGVAGTTYQTENYSNLKIESVGSFVYPGLTGASGPQSFTVTFPDGSQAFYGGTADSRGLMEWMINRWIDPQGNYIDYTYEVESSTIRIKKISWGKNANSTSTYENLIEFTYKSRIRAEYSYLKNIKIAATKILSFVSVKTGGIPFKTYTLEHETISGNYQRVRKVIESNGAGETANPVVFDYNITPEGFGEFSYYKSPTNSYLTDVKLSGDFDGDGNVDFVTNNKLYSNPITNNNVWSAVDFNFAADYLFTATTLSNNKLNQFQSVIAVTENDASITFTVNDFDKSTNSVLTKSVFSYTANFTDRNGFFNDVYGYGSGPMTCSSGGTSYLVQNKGTYLDGDFDGDGISDILFFRNLVRADTNYYCMGDGCVPQCEQVLTNTGGTKSLILNFKDNTFKEVSNLNQLYDSNLVYDFNGDGKSDIISINKYTKAYKVFEYNNLTSQINLLFAGSFTENLQVDYKDKQLVFGDFNGDGKTDIMIPEANQSTNWFLYQSTGAGFERIAYPNFENYEPYWQGAPSANRLKLRNYRAADLNKDGKSDFIINEYESWCVAVSSNGCDRNARGWFRYKQNLGSLATQPVFAANVETYVSSDYGYNDQISLLIGDFKNHNANFNFAFIQGAQIWKGSFNKDLSQEASLVKVTEAGGAITQSISYGALQSSSGLGDVNDMYYSSNTETYPYTELIQVPTLKVVDKVTVTGAGQTKSQLFKYFGLVAHSGGLGVLGFKKIARSSWYNDANTAKIWSCSQMNPQLLGQKLYEWTYSGDDHSSFTNPPIATAGLTDLGITINSFTSNFLTNGVKIIVPNKSEKKDFLTGLSSKTEFFYDTYWNINRTLATNAVGTKETLNTFFDNLAGVGKLYALGRITQTNETVNAYGDSYTTEEKFSYHPTATNLVQQSLKKGHLTDYITTAYVYDVFGNVTQKTISAPGVTNRAIMDKYDLNGRFVTEKTDHELYVTTFEYNPLGQVTKTTDLLDVVRTTNYDNWGKITQNAATGVSSSGQSSTITYTRFTDGGFSVTTTDSNTNEISRSFQDVFGRNIKSTTKGFALNSWISKSTEYDFLGRKTRESEPYSDSNPTLAVGAGTKWNTVTYDYLSRPIGHLYYNGKAQTISYTGLSTTTVDSPKTIKVTIDANGNKTELIDNSEALTFTYYANGTPKETIYGSHKITTNYDGWGRQNYMHDPSVSPTAYTYTYNNYGEMLTEGTPTGVTTITYSPTGRITKRTSIGQNTNLESNYVYNSKGMITSETGTSNGKVFNYSYVFNPLWQLITKTEVTPDNLTHIKAFTYDSQGRTLQERTHSYLTNSNTVHNGDNTIEYGYNTYNGILEQFKEVPTNTVLWKLNSANEKMQALTASLGNGMLITNSYDANDYVKTINHTHNAGVNVAVNLEYQFKGDRGTLDYRKNTIAGVLSWNETFVYDSFERLISWTDPTGTGTNTYETDGRIKTNNLVGTYNYDSSNRYRKASAVLNSKGDALYSTRSPQTVAYNMFKNPISVIEVTRGRVNFEFNLGNSRSKSIILKETGTLAKTKYYSGISTVEVIEKPNQTLQFITYIAGSPYDAVVALEKTYTINGASYTPSTQELLYLHRDYQGTILAISGNGGSIKERRHFDPWGVIKKHYKNNVEVPTSAFTNVDFEFLTDRGYTGHEHFFSVGIIHMNGRIYDPVLRTFLSPDSLISNANDSQNYNRYAYAMNNPLLYVDYDGNEPITFAAVATAALIGALIGGAVYTGMALYTGTFSWGGLTKSIVIGAISGAASGGIGNIIETASSSICAATATLTQTQISLMLMLPQAAMHGIAQGIIQGISGGDIGQSVLTAVVSSIASGGYLSIGGSVSQSGVGLMLFGTVAGGVTSKFQGGNFWEGAAIGLVVSGLNHFAHTTKTNRYIDKRLRYLGKDPDATAQIEQSELGGFAEDMFPDMMEQADDAPFVLKDKIISPNGQPALGQTMPYRDSDGGVRASNIEISRSALRSWHTLASTIGHELNHYVFFNSGAYDRWEQKFGPVRAAGLGEYKAHYWEYKWGGSPSIDIMNSSLKIFKGQ